MRLRLRHLRLRRSLALLPALGGVLLLSATAAKACEECAGEETHVPTIVYGASALPVLLPPVAYGLDPSDARRAIYVVNQGPVYSGPGIVTYADPTYSEGGYAYALPYPYVGIYGPWYDESPPRYHRHHRPTARPHAARPYDDGRYWRAPHVLRPHAGAYRYRAAPSARVIRVGAPQASPAPMPQARPSAPPQSAPRAAPHRPAPGPKNLGPNGNEHTR
ncbi:MAG: hypothetical protein HY056_13915 [Proteobacteria bacterium]|nr:hypothetical protein [Pseudomonadota bacterium]